MKSDERMTSLNVEETVKKTDLRIALRGALDSLHAEMAFMQAMMAVDGNEFVAGSLLDAAALLEILMRGTPAREELAATPLFGHTLEDMRRLSHEKYSAYAGKDKGPLYLAGKVLSGLNLLRARTREAELLAAHVAEHHPEYGGAQYALNRLSSGLYYLFVKEGGLS